MQQLINLDDQTDKQIDAYYDECLAYIRDHLLQFYQQYADENGLSISQARARISKWDLNQWKQAINEVDMSGWPKAATDRVKMYGATAGIDKAHVMLAIIGLALLRMMVKQRQAIQQRSVKDARDEAKRMKVAYKLTPKQSKKVTSIITQPETVKQWSARLWTDHDMMANDVENLVNQYLRHGATLNDLQDGLKKHVNKEQFKPNQSIADCIAQAQYNTQRLVRTESARLVDQVTMTTLRMKGVKWIQWVTEPGACSKCMGIADSGPYAIDDCPSIPDDSHPNCRCSKVSIVRKNQ